jgi:HK97 gp10 family phage protein
MSKFDQINLDIINEKQLLELFKELQFTEQNKIINRGLKKAAKPIIDQAKQNFISRRKNKSTTSYSDFNSSFKVEPRKQKDLVGLKIGVKYIDKTGRKNWYKYRWIEWGTKDRYASIRKNGLFGSQKINGAGRFTGKMEATHFFYDAVEARKEQALNDVSQYVTKSMEEAVKKYESK